MKALMKTEAAPGAEIRDIDVPEPGPKDILIKIKAAAICGTDIHIYEWMPFAQTRVCLEKVKRVLAAAGASMDDVVKATVFLRNAEDFTKMNEVYQGFFPDDKPARSTVLTGLVLPEMLVEIECIAYRQT